MFKCEKTGIEHETLQGLITAYQHCILDQRKAIDKLCDEMRSRPIIYVGKHQTIENISDVIQPQTRKEPKRLYAYKDQEHGAVYFKEQCLDIPNRRPEYDLGYLNE